MKILIWKAHGDIKAYCAETSKQLKEIVNKIKSVTIRYGDEYAEAVNKLIAEIDSTPYSTKQYAIINRSIEVFVENWLNCSDDDNFERFYFTTVKYD